MNLVRAITALVGIPRSIGSATPFVHRHDPERIRALQRSAAREAWLSDQTPGQRQLAAPDYGDIH